MEDFASREILPFRSFHVIEYPGLVNNPDRAVETMGGLGSIENVNALFNLV